MDSPRLQVRKRRLSIDSRLQFNGEEIPGVRTVMVTPFQDLDETHLSIIMDTSALNIKEEPEPEDINDKVMEQVKKYGGTKQ